jgi:hypothetical protein
MMNDFIALRMYDMSKDKEIERLKLIIATAIRIYEKCEETQDYSTCDLDMYEVLKGVHNEEKGNY